MFSIIRTLAERVHISSTRVPPEGERSSQSIRFEHRDITDIFESRINPINNKVEWGPQIILGDDGRRKIQEISPTGVVQFGLEGPPEGSEALKHVLLGLGILPPAEVSSVLQAVVGRCGRQSCAPFDLDGRISDALEDEAANRLRRTMLVKDLRPFEKEQTWELIVNDCEHCLNCLRLTGLREKSYTQEMLKYAALAVARTTKAWAEIEQGKGWEVVGDELSEAAKALTSLTAACCEEATPYVDFYNEINNFFLARYSDRESPGLEYEVGRISPGPDMLRFVAGFDYSPLSRSSRIIRGNDENSYVQQRTLLGVEQFITHGSWSFALLPDGKPLALNLVAERLEQRAVANGSAEPLLEEKDRGIVLNAIDFHTRRMALLSAHQNEFTAQAGHDEQLVERLYDLLNNGTADLPVNTKRIRSLVKTVIGCCKTKASALMEKKDYIAVELEFDCTHRKLRILTRNSNSPVLDEALERLDAERRIFYEQMPVNAPPRMRALLQEELALAVDNEQYEKAASIDKQLKALPKPAA